MAKGNYLTIEIRNIKKAIKIDYDDMGVSKRLLASEKYKSLAG